MQKKPADRRFLILIQICFKFEALVSHYSEGSGIVQQKLNSFRAGFRQLTSIFFSRVNFFHMKKV